MVRIDNSSIYGNLCILDSSLQFNQQKCYILTYTQSMVATYIIIGFSGAAGDGPIAPKTHLSFRYSVSIAVAFKNCLTFRYENIIV